MKLIKNILIAGLIFAASSAFANDYIKGNVGDSWTYDGNSPASSITAYSSSTGWRTYSDFANLGAMQVWSTSSNNQVYVYRSDLGSSSKYFADLGAAVGTTNTVPTALCSTGYTKIASRGDTVTTTAGTFSSTVTLQCGDNKIIFAKNVGIISELGSVACYAAPCPLWYGMLTAAKVNGTSYPAPVAAANLALTAVATAHSTYSSSYAASKMNDGSTSTSWVSGASTGSTQFKWTQLSWTTTQTVKSIKVTWYNSTYYARNIAVQVLQNGMWTQIGTVTSTGSELTINVSSLMYALNMQADAIKLAMTDANSAYIAIKEITVN